MHFDRTRLVKKIRIPALLAMSAFVMACATVTAAPSETRLPTITVRVNEHAVLAEVADNDARRQTGLMNRPKLADNHGMLFAFRRSEIQCMWMKNTLIDLDVAFTDEEGRILNVEQMKAGTTDIHCSKGPARYALEMNLNWFKKRGIDAGGQLNIPGGVESK